MNFLDLLDNTFSKLLEDIGYLFIDRDSKVYYVQKNGKHRIRNIYFDIKEGNFISYDTIRTNKRTILKLKEYEAQHQLLCWIPDEEGYRVRVYNRYGELIYKHYIKFFNKVSKLRKYLMKKRYQELCLDD